LARQEVRRAANVSRESPGGGVGQGERQILRLIDCISHPLLYENITSLADTTSGVSPLLTTRIQESSTRSFFHKRLGLGLGLQSQLKLNYGKISLQVESHG
jgi:hypothetical protein